MNLIKRIIVKLIPSIVYDEKTALKAIKNLNEKLQREKENSAMWRNRALETERFIVKSKSAVMSLALEFDRYHGTNVYFKM